jgi:OmpA-OmpF porin, OOP family
MKNVVFIFALIGFILMTYIPVNAQVKDPADKVEDEGSTRINKTIDKGIDKGFDAIEGGLKGIFGKGKKSQPEPKVQQTSKPETTVQEDAPVQVKAPVTQSSGPSLSWAKYDFVPGDKVIFEDNLIGEENGEFPSRWDLVQGTIENARFGDDNIIMFREGSPMIIPYLKNPQIDYLPEVFTIEFDLYVNNHNNFQVYFYDRKNQRASSLYQSLLINHRGMNLHPAASTLPDNASIKDVWAHIAIAYTEGKMKAYINETRLINIPRLAFDPMGVSLHAYHASDKYKFFVKNIRIAEGGVKYYDRFLQDGKIVSNGIRFDTGKASLRPESMGVINEIYKMLSDHPELKVSVEGHTDSDGDDALNQALSEQRAETVVNTLKNMGIDLGRLTSKGWGESKPLDINTTPEGKANNRRVEFVKM